MRNVRPGLKGLSFATSLALALVLPGCASLKVNTTSQRLTVLEGGVEASTAISVDRAYQLPRTIHAWPFGGVSDGHYLAFGIEPPAEVASAVADKNNQTVPERNLPGRYGVIDESTRTLTVFDSLAKRANTNYLTLTRDAKNSTFLVRVEAIELPHTQCPEIPITCYSWQITAQKLPKAEPRIIAKSEIPTAATDVPVPISSGTLVAWLHTRKHGMSEVYVWSPGSAAHPISMPLATGTMSMDARNVWIGTPYGHHSLTKIPLNGDAQITLDLPPTAAIATVNGELVAYRADASQSSREVCLAKISSPQRCHQIMHAKDIYGITWLTRTKLLVSTPNGYAVVSTDGSISSTSLDYLTVVHSNGREIVMLMSDGAMQFLAIGHLRT